MAWALASDFLALSPIKRIRTGLISSGVDDRRRQENDELLTGRGGTGTNAAAVVRVTAQFSKADNDHRLWAAIAQVGIQEPLQGVELSSARIPPGWV